jgi:predicted Zn finger-like uncharacterized protein
MKFVCERCHTKYSIADEKVRGKVLKVRCKTCENVITVRESGASIDEPITAGAKDLPIVRSGTLEGAARGTGAARGAAAARRSPGAAGGGGGGAIGPSGAAVATAVSARQPIPAAAFSDPLAPAEAPPAPRGRPPAPPAGAAMPVVVDDGLDWYLAVDGAQTGPFDRPTLIEKILAVPPDGDIHVWNAGLGAWKPPQDVADVEADVVRMRRAAHVIPPVPSSRRSGEAAHALAGHGAAAEAAPHHGAGTNGVATLAGGAVPAAHGGAKAPAHEKTNGVGSGGAAHGGFGLEDLFNETSGGTSTAAATEAQASNMLGALPSATMASSAGVAPALPSSNSAALSQPSRQTKLIMGAVALAVIVCGIVAVALLRKPSVATVANPPREPGSNELQAKPPAAEPPPVAAPAATPPPATPEPNPVAAKTEARAEVRAEAPGKSGRGKGRRRGASGTSPTAPPPIGGMTAEQLQAASRFGQATSRDIRAVPTASSSARSTPAQADISRVISNNRQGIQTCYQRALLRDSTLTQGKVTVRVSIGISGRVKSVNLDAPPQFRSMESCVRDVMSRWAFPPSSEEYGTEFPVVLQGNQ